MKTKIEKTRTIFFELTNDEIERILAKALNDGSYNHETVTLTWTDLLRVPKTHVIAIVVDEEDEVKPEPNRAATPEDDDFVPPQEKYISDFMEDLLNEEEVSHARFTFEEENERLKYELARAHEIISKARTPVKTTVSTEDGNTTMLLHVNDVANIIKIASFIIEKQRANSVGELDIKLAVNNGRFELLAGDEAVGICHLGAREDADQVYSIQPDVGTFLTISSVEDSSHKQRRLGDGIYRVARGRMDKMPPDAQIHLPFIGQVDCPVGT